MLYVLERFLYRLSVSPHRQRLVLKGGMLLAAFDERRPTRDVDLLAVAVSNDLDTVSSLIRDIVAIDVDDGVVYAPDRLSAERIREQDLYAAARIVVPASVDRAQHPLRVDVNVSDPVTPAPIEVDYPALLDGSFTVFGYPIQSVLAEKVVTMVQRGDTTTRERDFADVLLLAGHHDIDAAQLSEAIAATSTHRRAALRPLSEALSTLGRDRRIAWQQYLARSGLERALPREYEEAITRVARFVDPILTGAVNAGRWDHAHGRWTE